MKKKFEFEFTDKSSNNEISFEYDDEDEEEIEIIIENGMPVLYANSQALLVLAKTFIKMAMCDYKTGFHVHFHKDLDADKPNIIRCVLKK